MLPTTPGQSVAFTAVKNVDLNHGAEKDTTNAINTHVPVSYSSSDVGAIIATRRQALLARFAAYSRPTPGDKGNETFAGMATGIAWNVVYVPYEGIITPVFRGSPWSVSKPHNYVLFEWDTFFAAAIAATPGVDRWIAVSNVVRMVKSLIADPFVPASAPHLSGRNVSGFVAGFWNGQCGEVDKSKPPVGGLVLQRLLHVENENQNEDENKNENESSSSNEWVGELLLDQFVMWNRWWTERRVRTEPVIVGVDVASTGINMGEVNVNGTIAPGSSREMMKLSISCTNQV